MKRDQVIVMMLMVALVTGYLAFQSHRTTMGQTLTPTSGAEGNPSITVTREKKTEPNLSSLYVWISAPARSLVIAPDGRRVGFDKLTGQELSEVPSSGASMEGKIVADDDLTEGVSTGAVSNRLNLRVPEDSAYVIGIDDPVQGIYNVEVVASPGQDYILDVQGSDRHAESNVFILKSKLQLNEKHVYTFKFNPEPAQKALEMVSITDPTGDGLVDCKDIQRVKDSLGSKYKELAYDSRVDAVRDGVIDSRDLDFITQALSSGTTCSE